MRARGAGGRESGARGSRPGTPQRGKSTQPRVVVGNSDPESVPDANSSFLASNHATCLGL